MVFRVLLDRPRGTRLAPGPGWWPHSFIPPLEGKDAGSVLVNSSKRMRPHQTSLSPRKSRRSSTGTNAREAQGGSDTALESEGTEQARALSMVKAEAELSQDIRSFREVLLNRKALLHSLNTRIPSFNSNKTITSFTSTLF